MADIPDLSTSALDSVNVPGIVVLASSGVLGMIFVVRLMVKFQREFTNFYIEENTKLRVRIDLLEDEVIAKQDKISELLREQIRYEVHSQREMNELNEIVARHERTIERLTRQVKTLETPE